MTSFHHGITGRESQSGKIPIRDAATNIIAMIAFADDADETTFPLNTPVLVTSINRALPKAGTTGNLRKNLEIISQITSPTLVIIRISDPFQFPEFDQSLVIGTTDENGKRTGLQALLTVKSVLGITPKIICVPDTETLDVANALGAICKRLRAYAYITPRQSSGDILEKAEDVVNFRNMLAFREIELIWPEWTNGNVFQGAQEEEFLEPTSYNIKGGAHPTGISSLTYDLFIHSRKIESNAIVSMVDSTEISTAFTDLLYSIFTKYPQIQVISSSGGQGYFHENYGTVSGGEGNVQKDPVRLVIKQNPSRADDLFPLLIDFYTSQPFVSPLELITLGLTTFEGS